MTGLLQDLLQDLDWGDWVSSGIALASLLASFLFWRDSRRWRRESVVRERVQLIVSELKQLLRETTDSAIDYYIADPSSLIAQTEYKNVTKGLSRLSSDVNTLCKTDSRLDFSQHFLNYKSVLTGDDWANDNREPAKAGDPKVVSISAADAEFIEAVEQKFGDFHVNGKPGAGQRLLKGLMKTAQFVFLNDRFWKDYYRDRT